MDPEAPIRAFLEDKLEENFSVFQEVALKDRRGQSVRCDLLLIPRAHSAKSAIAVEIKSIEPKQPKNCRDTFLQALSYIDVDIVDRRCSSVKVPIRGALIFQPRFRWLENNKSSIFMDEKISHSLQNDGIELVFNSFNIGVICHKENNLSFRFGHIDIWSTMRGWRSDISRCAKWLG